MPFANRLGKQTVLLPLFPGSFTMKRTFYALAAAAALTAFVAAPASAAPISASASINFLGVTANSNDVNAATSFTYSAAQFANVGNGNLSGFALGTAVTAVSPFVFSPSSTQAAFLTFTSGGVTGVFDLASEVVTNRNATTSGGTISIFALGTLHLTGFDNTAASLNLSATESGTGGNATWSLSGTLQAPPAPPPGVPEPITLALFGAGLAGMGMMRRKKKSA
jgi:hypothetical protein